MKAVPWLIALVCVVTVPGKGKSPPPAGDDDEIHVLEPYQIKGGSGSIACNQSSSITYSSLRSVIRISSGEQSCL